MMFGSDLQVIPTTNTEQVSKASVLTATMELDSSEVVLLLDKAM
jgi:hypothetical protein